MNVQGKILLQINVSFYHELNLNSFKVVVNLPSHVIMIMILNPSEISQTNLPM